VDSAGAKGDEVPSPHFYSPSCCVCGLKRGKKEKEKEKENKITLK
jgi:hypothetical protein